MKKNIDIDGEIISDENRTFLIAEIGLNHNKDINLTKKMILSAKESGANAVKFQTYITENLLVDDSPAFGLFKGLELDETDFSEISDYCKDIGIIFFSTPFCFKSVDLLEKLEVPCYKVASMDVNYYDLLKYIGNTGKPIFLSTGMSSLSEIDKAVEVILSTGNDKIVIMHCISKYPPENGDMNLNFISKLKSIYPDNYIGFSDHTRDSVGAIIARALGVSVIEKHFTLDKNLPGPDHLISNSPEDFKDLYLNLKKTDSALLTDIRNRGDLSIAKGARRSLCANRDLPAGTVLNNNMIKTVRPGGGVAPEFLPIFIGKTLKVDVKGNQYLALDFI